MRTERYDFLKRNKKGFTLAELLIVVAIIAVLVAISIPIFTSQLEKAREATDAANIRSQYAEVMSEAITSGGDVNGKSLYGAVQLKQKKDGWQTSNLKENLKGMYAEVKGGGPKAGGTAWVEYISSSESVILHYEGGSSSGSSSDSGSGSGGTDSGSTSGGGSSSGTGDNTGGSTSGSGQDIPLTNLPEVFKSSASDWNTIVKENPTYKIVLGKIYTYQGSVYFGTKEDTIKNDANNHHDLTEITNWFSTAKYTGKIWDASDFVNERNDVNRGDLCKVGDSYYVFKDGGNTSRGPVNQSDQWQKIILTNS
jgi:prepilin-type N-terminal cleavage/methylation domain-containing protein